MTSFKNVLLPAPEDPTIKTNSPLSTVRLILWRASVPLLYTFDTFRNSIKAINLPFSARVVGKASLSPVSLEGKTHAATKLMNAQGSTPGIERIIPMGAACIILMQK